MRQKPHLIVTVLLEVKSETLHRLVTNRWDLVVRLEGECLMRVIALLAIMEEAGV